MIDGALIHCGNIPFGTDEDLYNMKMMHYETMMNEALIQLFCV